MTKFGSPLGDDKHWGEKEGRGEGEDAGVGVRGDEGKMHFK